MNQWLIGVLILIPSISNAHELEPRCAVTIIKPTVGNPATQNHPWAVDLPAGESIKRWSSTLTKVTLREGSYFPPNKVVHYLTEPLKRNPELLANAIESAEEVPGSEIIFELSRWNDEPRRKAGVASTVYPGIARDGPLLMPYRSRLLEPGRDTFASAEFQLGEERLIITWVCQTAGDQ
jgi:hypothetical protein